MVSEVLRSAAVGGTDIAAILGIDSWRDAFSVWAEKTGRLQRTPATLRMRLGKYFERGIIQYYTDLTGRETDFIDETRRHPVYPFMVWTPDAICRHERRGVDAKMVSWDQKHLWGEGADDIPSYIQCQCHWYMAAEDFPYWDVIAIVGSDEPRVYTLERDRDIEAAILASAEEFWRRYLIGDEQPAIGDSPESTRYLRERFPRNVYEIREANELEAGWLDDYAELRAELDAIEGDRRLFENQIKEAIGDGDGLTWPGGKFTWKNTKDGQKVDWEPLARSLMASLNDEERKLIEKEYTTVKPGVRRIDFRTKERKA